jgi:hypothetical protein
MFYNLLRVNSIPEIYFWVARSFTSFFGERLEEGLDAGVADLPHVPVQHLQYLHYHHDHLRHCPLFSLLYGWPREQMPLIFRSCP